MKGVKILACLSILVILLSKSSVAEKVFRDPDDDFINPSWVKPDIWRSQKRRDPEPPKVECEKVTKPCQCPPAPVCLSPDQRTMHSYRKFVTRLFDENLLEKEVDSDYLVRKIQLKITNGQLTQLKTAQSIGDIDAVIASIVEQSGKMTFYERYQLIAFNLKDFFRGLGNSIFFLQFATPVLYIIVGYLLITLLSRMMQINRWFLLLLLLAGISYSMSYEDCNRKLEAEALARVSFNKIRNPCKENNSGWLDYLNPLNMFSESNERKCYRHLLDTHNLHIGQCNPAQVVVQMIGSLQMEYFEVVIEKTTQMLSQSSWIGICLIILVVYLFITNIPAYMLSTAKCTTALLSTRRIGELPSETTQSIAPAPTNIKVDINLPSYDSSMLNRLEDILIRNVSVTNQQSITEKPNDDRDESEPPRALTSTVLEACTSPASDVQDLHEPPSEPQSTKPAPESTVKTSSAENWEEKKPRFEDQPPE
ncbi:uncharacterized protein LOC129745384 [Uranotaenia lowii]|uniref:uncharacterized protein LOC129745384 n=1 Tax=Uranotaenia lowii TaxID=190385 RepID=UPI00247A4132|nr:uncharacterized protein LOC129745384 [Uranotaenia lowii]